MKDGVVQQVDTPQNLYQKPGNLFVAGFMGSPQMNFLDAEIKEKGSDLVAVIGKDELVIPAAKAKALKDGGYVGKTVVMGIRPEDVADRADGSMSSTVKGREFSYRHQYGLERKYCSRACANKGRWKEGDANGRTAEHRT